MNSSRTILVTGGTGTIGSALVEGLARQGYSLRVLTLPDDPGGAALEKDGVDVRYGDVSIPESVDGICKGVATVVHMAAVVIADDDRMFDNVNVTGTRYLLTDAHNHGVTHFVYVSSASVVYRKMTPYSRSKRIAERYVRSSNVPWTIVRPTLVYGEKGGMEFDMFLEYLSVYPVIPFIGSGMARKRPVYVNDLVDGLVHIAQRETGTGKTYNFSGGSSISMIDFARLCLVLLGSEDKLILHIPVTICRILAVIMAKVTRKPLLRWNMIAGVIQDADLDPSEAMKDLGYRPLPVETKLKDCFPRI